MATEFALTQHLLRILVDWSISLSKIFANTHCVNNSDKYSMNTADIFLVILLANIMPIYVLNLMQISVLNRRLTLILKTKRMLIKYVYYS